MQCRPVIDSVDQQGLAGWRAQILAHVVHLAEGRHARVHLNDDLVRNVHDLLRDP
jgi:hypothetical protein